MSRAAWAFKLPSQRGGFTLRDLTPGSAGSLGMAWPAASDLFSPIFCKVLRQLRVDEKSCGPSPCPQPCGSSTELEAVHVLLNLCAAGQDGDLFIPTCPACN